MADEPLDIFTAIHRAIWAALNAHVPFTDLVDLRNRVDMTDDDFEEFPPNTPEDATPEVAVIQQGWSQEKFDTSSAGVRRSQAYAFVVTTGKLGPRKMNRVKEAVLDALLGAGLTLGVAKVNGNQVIGWTVGGEDALTPIEPTPGEDRSDVRSQTVGRVTVQFLKALPKRQHV